MKRNNITKNDITKMIKINYGLPISYSEKLFDYLFDILKKGLKNDGIIKISGFGTFKVLFKQKRIGMNPKTGFKYPINARKVVIFSPSKVIKNKFNGKK